MPNEKQQESIGSMALQVRIAVLLVVCGGAFLWGYFAHRNHIFPYNAFSKVLSVISDGDESNEAAPLGRWQETPEWRQSADSEATEARSRRKRLSTLGYLDGYVEPSSRQEVVVHQSPRANAGYNLYVSGHGPEVRLIDMEGNSLHVWRKEFLDVWPDYSHFGGGKSRENPPHYFFRSYLFENGDVLALYEGHGLIKLDKESRLIWKYRGGANGGAVGCHHDLWVEESGDIYVLTYDRGDNRVPEVNQSRPIWEDHVAILDPNGKQKARFSLVEAFLDSDYASLLEPIIGAGQRHALHANSIQVLSGANASISPAFAKGNILVSLRELNAVAVVDAQTRRVVWAATGPWMRQHSARILPHGGMLLFDNRGQSPKINGREFSGTSRVLEYDLATQMISWEYGDEPSERFFSQEMGVSQRLDNGNTLVTDSVSGRAFEVDGSGEVVWEWRSPHLAGSDDDLVATLTQMLRVSPSLVDGWLGGGAGE